MKFVILTIVILIVVFYVVRNSNHKKAAQENITVGNEFLTTNKANAEVQETASGLQYQILNKGEGDAHPTAGSTVKVHYHGTLLDGTVFDSSVERNEPISFPLNRVIKGWTEGVQLMVVGDKFKFFIPSRLAYGNSPAGAITPGSLLIFEVELLAIE
ncbi:peptidylprolyl isomerase [Oceanisphaera profunda]|uniref:Peptidyl-prolyl cis-trans isomerase n=1 Tax=Oceanisphaera profunda TaxID=1416627 RepID=A0A1Y0D1Z8_9GAMM|nr:FKBP-type peptidyl-prolyl cis-trans isomerase [Oceanisphaera profunda]ART81354.1 peptidylprolyl isomerase [Oceanisphaera profunda]